MTDAATLTPPDFNRCQAFPNAANHNPFSLGPRPRPIRCDAAPVWLAVEKIAGADGLHGSMTVCQQCCELMMQSTTLRQRIQLQPLHTEGATP